MFSLDRGLTTSEARTPGGHKRIPPKGPAILRNLNKHRLVSLVSLRINIQWVKDTQWTTDLLEKLAVPQLVRKFPEIYKTGRFIAVLSAICPYQESDPSNSHPPILFRSSVSSGPALFPPISSPPSIRWPTVFSDPSGPTVFSDPSE